MKRKQIDFKTKGFKMRTYLVKNTHIRQYYCNTKYDNITFLVKKFCAVLGLIWISDLKLIKSLNSLSLSGPLLYLMILYNGSNSYKPEDTRLIIYVSRNTCFPITCGSFSFSNILGRFEKNRKSAKIYITMFQKEKESHFA